MSNSHLIENYYIILKIKDPQLHQNSDEIEIKQQMQYDNKNQIYQTTIKVQTKIRYQYQYAKKINDNFIYEVGFRGFQYSSVDPLLIDQWNKQWYQYIFTYGGYNQNIFNGYQAVIRDYDSPHYREILFEKNHNYMHCKEIIDMNIKKNNRQLCFNQINQDGKRLDSSEQIQIIDVSKVNEQQKFISNLALIEFKEIDSKTKQRIETYSGIYNEMVIMKQQLKDSNQSKDLKQNIQEIINHYDIKIAEINQKHLLDLMRKDQDNKQAIINLEQKQKDQMEQLRENHLKQNISLQKEFDDFKNYSEKVIQKYINQNERANQKILDLELSKVNFQSEEIKIQVEDFNQLSKNEQDNLKQLQENLKIYEFKIQEIKQENDNCQEKLEKKQLKLKGSMNELKKCQQLLEKWEKDSLILKEVNQIGKDQFEKKSIIYQTKLKEIQVKLNKKGEELKKFMDALEELENKYKIEKQNNIRQQVEFQKETKKLKDEYNKEMNEQIIYYNSILEQQKQTIQQLKIDKANQEEKINLNNNIDQESKKIYEKLRNEQNSKNLRQQSIKNSNQQFNQIIQNIYNLLTLQQGDIIQNLKEQGLQIIQDLQTKYINQHALVDLNNENFLMQICKLIVILSYSINKGQQESKHIEDLKQLENQLYENVKIIMIKKKNNKILSNKIIKRFFSITVLIVLTLIYQFMIHIPISV
ncbi:unnamed protein product [Paramecium pentaurelia]|uniref:Uncharacterized protein n=1 Tax=Paramecium pentaurelia TaxID=43138 RepID=A0A8S1TXE8_9CILI|nr:unnamed protein product [Paramecium pentaurelia]